MTFKKTLFFDAPYLRDSNFLAKKDTFFNKFIHLSVKSEIEVRVVFVCFFFENHKVNGNHQKLPFTLRKNQHP